MTDKDETLDKDSTAAGADNAEEVKPAPKPRARRAAAAPGPTPAPSPAPTPIAPEDAPKTELVPPPGSPEAALPGGDKPMPSQPRTFVSRAPGSGSSAKMEAAKPTAAPKPKAAPAASESAKPRASAAPAPRPSGAGPRPNDASGTTRSSFPGRAAAAGTAAAGATAAGAAAAGTGSTTSAKPVGGDTVRLRVNPSQRAQTPGGAFPTSTVPRPARRLPDIRRRQTAPSTSPSYGPFSMFFGFIWLIFKMLFFSALVMALAAGAGYAILHWYIKTPTVTVPNVRGMKVGEAFDVLSEKKLGMVKVRSESSGLVAPGEIIEQNPQAGSSTKEGRAVGVVVSSGRSRYMVPSVVGESVDNARNKIKGAGLEVGNELRLEDPNVPKEAVISQQPAANTGADEPIKVDLLVSSGPPGKSLTMPELTGRSLAEARAGLQRLGITDITVEPPDAGPDAMVTLQEPLVGKSLFQTDRVTLTTRR